MAPRLTYAFTHPLDTTFDLLNRKWKPFLFDQLEERLPRQGILHELLVRFRDGSLREAPSTSGVEGGVGGQRSSARKARSQGARKAAGGHVMQLYVVRHGIAIEEGGVAPDASRPLGEKGRRRFRKTARAFGKLGHRLDLILTSPLVRAVQTAEILAGATDYGEVAVLEELDPKFPVETLREAIEARAGKAGAVAIVGHEPQLSSLLAALSGVPQTDIYLKKGAIVRVDARKLTDGARADVRWWLKPKGTRAKGLPLQKQAGEAEGSAAVTSPEARRGPRSGRQERRKRQSRRKPEGRASRTQAPSAPESAARAEEGASAEA
jgi:phosphohistidine phosphatase